MSASAAAATGDLTTSACFLACSQKDLMCDSQRSPCTFGDIWRNMDTATRFKPFSKAMSKAICWYIGSHFWYNFSAGFPSGDLVKTSVDCLQHKRACKYSHIKIRTFFSTLRLVISAEIAYLHGTVDSIPASTLSLGTVAARGLVGVVCGTVICTCLCAPTAGPHPLPHPNTPTPALIPVICCAKATAYAAHKDCGHCRSLVAGAGRKRGWGHSGGKRAWAHL